MSIIQLMTSEQLQFLFGHPVVFSQVVKASSQSTLKRQLALKMMEAEKLNFKTDREKGSLKKIMADQARRKRTLKKARTTKNLKNAILNILNQGPFISLSLLSASYYGLTFIEIINLKDTGSFIYHYKLNYGLAS